MKEILQELDAISKTVARDDILALVKLLENSYDNRIIGLGAGRMGYSLQAFIMRLSHLGFNAHMIGDTTLPRIGVHDIVLVNSSSGETPTVKLLCEIAKKHGAKIVGITSRPESSIAQLADIKLTYSPVLSKQMMKTLYEQFSFLLFDSIAAHLANKVPLTMDQVEKNHSILE